MSTEVLAASFERMITLHGGQDSQWTDMVVEIRNRACGFAGYKCSKSTATYAMLLILLSKIATRNHMTKNKSDDARQRRV